MYLRQKVRATWKTRADVNCIARVKELQVSYSHTPFNFARISVYLIIIHVLPVGLSRVFKRGKPHHSIVQGPQNASAWVTM